MKSALLGALDEVLSNASLTIADIKDVLVAGGMAHSPLLKRSLALYFKNPSLISDDDASKIKPSEAIALGCAKQAGVLCILADAAGQSNVDRESIEKNLTGEVQSLTLSLGVGNRNGVCTNVFPRGSIVPNTKSVTMKYGVGEDLKLKFFVGERADPAGNLLVGEIAVDNADYATKSFTFDVSIDKNGKTLTVKIDGESKTVVEGVEFIDMGEVESIVTSSTTSSAKSEDAVCLAKAELNDYIFVLLETDEILNDIEEEDVDEIKGKVAEIRGSSQSPSALLVELKQFVDDIIAQYEEEDEEEELVIVDNDAGGDLD